MLGECGRCGGCCASPVVSIGLMRESEYCKYLSFEEGLAVCEFAEGRTTPPEAYIYWDTCCKHHPKSKSDIDSSVSCSYTWGLLPDGVTLEEARDKHFSNR